MNHRGILKSALKRGGLLTAANWQVVVIQFIADSTFKVLSAVPIFGGAVLVALLARGSVFEILRGDPREVFAAVTDSLMAVPAALAAFLFALGLVVAGGAAFMFFVKGGTVSVLASAEGGTPPIEREPFDWDRFEAAGHFSIVSFVGGARLLFRRYLFLGFGLIGAYLASAVVYLAVLYVGYRYSDEGFFLIGWTMVAAVLSSALIVWITIVNLVYVLTQVVIAVSGLGLRASLREVFSFLSAELWDIVGVFTVTLVLAVVATGAMLGATAGLGLIAFAPLAGLAVLPLQITAWLLRSLAFQYLGLTALEAYLHLYRTTTGRRTT